LSSTAVCNCKKAGHSFQQKTEGGRWLSKRGRSYSKSNMLLQNIHLNCTFLLGFYISLH